MKFYPLFELNLENKWNIRVWKKLWVLWDCIITIKFRCDIFVLITHYFVQDCMIGLGIVNFGYVYTYLDVTFYAVDVVQFDQVNARKLIYLIFCFQLKL